MGKFTFWGHTKQAFKERVMCQRDAKQYLSL